MSKIFSLFQIVRDKFFFFYPRQRVSILVTLIALLALPITLVALQYQQNIRSKAAGVSGRIIVFEPGMVTESNGVADTAANPPLPGVVSSQIVTLHIEFPDWNQQVQIPQGNQFVSLVSEVLAQTSPGCADSRGWIDGDSTRVCSDWVQSGAEDAENCNPGLIGAYASNVNSHYFSNCPVSSSQPTPTPSVGSLGGGMQYCCGDNSRAAFGGGSCNGSFDDGLNSSTGYKNYYCSACAGKKDVSGRSYEVCYTCQAGEKCYSGGNSVVPTLEPVGGRDERGVACADDTGAIWNNSTGVKYGDRYRCSPSSYSGDVASKQSCYDAGDPQARKSGLYASGYNAYLFTDCSLIQQYLSIPDPGGSGCQNQPYCPPTPTGGQNQQLTPTPQVILRGENETCDDTTYRCREGFECRNVGNESGRGTRECKPSSSTPEPSYTHRVYIDAVNGEVDANALTLFTYPSRYDVFSFTKEEADRYVTQRFLVRAFPLPKHDVNNESDVKTLAVRFCPYSLTPDPQDGRCRRMALKLTIRNIQTLPPPLPPNDRVLNRVQELGDRLGIEMTIQADGSFTMKRREPQPGQPQESIYKFPRLIDYKTEDLEFLVHVLMTSYGKHPYYELCPIFNNAPVEDWKRFHDILTKYGVDAPTLPAQWTSAQLQALNDSLYRDVNGNMLKDGVGPLPLPCNIHSPLINQIFSYTNNPNLEARNQLLAGNTGLALPDKFISDPKELKLHEDKLSGIILFEQLTWVAADIQLAQGVKWAVAMAEMMPITLPHSTLAQVWKYILPGETIEKALALRDRGAPIGFTVANYGQAIIGNFALLVAPVGLTGSLEGQVGGRLATQISRNRYPNIVLVNKDFSTGKTLLFDGKGSVSENALEELKISERSGNSITEVAEPKKSNFLIETFGTPIEEFGQEIGSGSHGVSYSNGKIVTKVYFNNAQGNINHINFYEKWGGAGGEYGLQRYYGKVTVNGDVRGVRLEYLPGLTLAEFGKAIKEGTMRKLTKTEVENSVRTLENIQRTTGQAMVDMTPGNFIVQDLPKGEIVVRPIDYGGQYPETSINFMQREINWYRDTLTDYCADCVKN